MLEHDIAHLGFDVDYVRHRMVPSEHIRAFMQLQESLCTGPRRDPSLFLAAPFAAEAPSGFLTKEFIEQLSRTIASWGVTDPRAQRWPSSPPTRASTAEPMATGWQSEGSCTGTSTGRLNFASFSPSSDSLKTRFSRAFELIRGGDRHFRGRARSCETRSCSETRR